MGLREIFRQKLSSLNDLTRFKKQNYTVSLCFQWLYIELNYSLFFSILFLLREFRYFTKKQDR